MAGRTDRAGGWAATCALLMLAGVTVAALAERRPASLQPGRDVIVGELAAGKLLVAARNLPDPNFTETVVLLVQYSRDGAAGLVLNRPTDVALSRVFPGVEHTRGATTTAFIGGPVSQQAVLALSRAACDACPRVGRDIYFVHTPAALKARLAEGADIRELRVYVGYAGWGGGQLEAETRQGAWRVLEADARAVFDPDPQSLWRRLIQRTEALLASADQPSGRHAELQGAITGEWAAGTSSR
jgi:putative transcriptional regulator